MTRVVRLAHGVVAGPSGPGARSRRPARWWPRPAAGSGRRGPGRGRWPGAGAGRRTGSWPARPPGCRSPCGRALMKPAAWAARAAARDLGLARRPRGRSGCCPAAEPENSGRVLGDQGHAVAHLGGVGVAQVDAVQPHRARLRVVEAQQQAQHRALARRPRDRPGPRSRRAVTERGRSPAGPAGRGGRDRRRSRPRRRCSPRAGTGRGGGLAGAAMPGSEFSSSADALHGAGGLLHVAPDLAQGADRAGGHHRPGRRTGPGCPASCSPDSTRWAPTHSSRGTPPNTRADDHRGHAGPGADPRDRTP